MPGPVSDSYDPVWGTAENESIVRDGISEMDAKLTEMLHNSPPRFILDVIREPNGKAFSVNLTEREMRILRFSCRVALEEESI
jgi:hypothetical protein